LQVNTISKTSAEYPDDENPCIGHSQHPFGCVLLHLEPLPISMMYDKWREVHNTLSWIFLHQRIN